MTNRGDDVLCGVKALLIILSFLFLIDISVFAELYPGEYWDRIDNGYTSKEDSALGMGMVIILVIIGLILEWLYNLVLTVLDKLITSAPFIWFRKVLIDLWERIISPVIDKIYGAIVKVVTTKTTYTFICVISFLLWWVPMVFGPHLGIDLTFLTQFVTAKEMMLYIMLPLLSINIVCFLILMYMFD